MISEQCYAFARSAIMKPTSATSMANIWLGIRNLTQPYTKLNSFSIHLNRKHSTEQNRKHIQGFLSTTHLFFLFFLLLSTFKCGHVVPRPASRLETCYPGHAWDLTIHDSCFYQTGTRLRWRTSGIHLGLGILLLLYPRFAILPTSPTSSSFPCPLFSPSHTPHQSIHSLKSR